MTTSTEQLPYQAPPRTLTKASLAALAGGAAILALFVLPAEYGIDPTGLGKTLGLTRMAVTEDDSAAGVEVEPTTQTVTKLVVQPQVQANIKAETQLRSDTRILTIKPHTGVELKAHMKQGDHFIFRWDASGGPVRMDMHGEPAKGPAGAFTTYWKEKRLESAQGSFTAPFEGTHGWYWRNPGETPVTIKIKVDGFYKDVFEPPMS